MPHEREIKWNYKVNTESFWKSGLNFICFIAYESLQKKIVFAKKLNS